MRRTLRIVSVEAVAEKWLLPRLASFKAAHPGMAIELETNHPSVDPSLRDFDAWLAYYRQRQRSPGARPACR